MACLGCASVPWWGLQHSGVHMCWWGGSWHRWGGSHRVFWRSEESDSSGAAHGPYGPAASRTNRHYTGGGTRGTSENLHKLTVPGLHKPSVTFKLSLFQTYNQSQSSRRSINKSIMGNKHSFHMFPHSPRMLPAGVTPTLHKMHISCAQFQHTDEKRRSSAKGRRSSLNAPNGGTNTLHLNNLNHNELYLNTHSDSDVLSNRHLTLTALL